MTAKTFLITAALCILGLALVLYFAVILPRTQGSSGSTDADGGLPRIREPMTAKVHIPSTVSKEAAAFLAELPGADEAFPPTPAPDDLEGWRAMYQAIDQAGVPVKLDLYEGMPHDFMLDAPSLPESILSRQKARAFIKTRLA